MARLRDPQDGCPWDREQDFRTIAPYTIEEAYEVADAISRQDLDGLRGELGDLLFQVVFHARLAEEVGAFDFAAVVEAICDKLERRHPHVFGDAAERAKGQQAGSWERIKAAERRDARDATNSSCIDGVPLALPALKRANKLATRAAVVGFDWPDADGVRSKVLEELAEFDAACAAASPAARTEELGDLLFSVSNLARHHGIDPEQALADANRKFELRFRRMEDAAASDGQDLESLSLPEMERYWEAAKLR